MLDEIGLIHMNGRLYDPEIGRFLQADPIIQEPLNGQNYNRYGYVQNNPLSHTDPTGFSWWTKWRRPIVGLVAAIAVPWAVGELFLANVGVGEIGTYAVGSIGSEAAALTASGQAVANVAGGLAAGAIQGGNVQSAVIGAFTAGLQFGVGQTFGHATPSLFGSQAGLAAQKALAHAAIGCASSEASGGSCKSGAAAAGFSSIAGGSIPGANNIIGRAVVGAVASRLAGGRAEQGALLGAMEYLYNEAAGMLAANKLQAAIAESGAVAAHNANGASSVLEKRIVYKVEASGGCRIVWARHISTAAEPRFGIIEKSTCGLSLVDQKPLRSSLLAKVREETNNLTGMRNFVWGQMKRGDATDEYAIRFGLAVAASKSWDRQHGVRTGKASRTLAFYPDTINRAKVFSEVAEVFAEQGFDLVAEDVEKVIVGKTDRGNVPTDAFVLFKVKPSKKKK
jgi:RHS repeat-associated protein